MIRGRGRPGHEADTEYRGSLMVETLTFADGWTDCGVSDTQRYKCLGNAVSVPVIAFLGRRIRGVLGG